MNSKLLTVYEYDKLNIGSNDKFLSKPQFEILENHYGKNGVPYYKLLHKGVQFNNHVGVIQLDGLTIEVLPKIDSLKNEVNWKSFLIELLLYTGEIKVDATDFSDLDINKLSILELYFSMYIKECEYLLHRGLVKKYRKKECNLYSLKGSLHFGKNISQNLIHAERFYTSHTVYDKQHLIHQVLLEAMCVIKNVSTSSNIHTAISQLFLNFPEQERLKIAEHTFSQIHIDRKTEPYQKAINIAKMILLNYHPDINKGRNSVLAIFFDMNLLWETYVAKVIQRYLPKILKLETQNVGRFWNSITNTRIKANIKPDIIIRDKEDKKVVTIIDTKWKLPNDNKPSDADLKQMFSYNNIFEGVYSWLLYPHFESVKSDGNFVKEYGCCGMMFLDIKKLNAKGHKDFFIKLTNMLNDENSHEEFSMKEGNSKGIDIAIEKAWGVIKLKRKLII